jgi:hypothetical protein
VPTFLFHTAENLRYIRESWGDLQTLRYPGTNRPWRQLFLTPERREAANRAAVAERAERCSVRVQSGPQWLAAEPAAAAGASPSPGLDDVIDTIAAAETAVFWLEDMARDLLGFSRTCTRCRHGADDHRRDGNADPCGMCGCHDFRRGASTPGEAFGSYAVRAGYTLTADVNAPWRRTFVPADREWVAVPAASGALHWSCMWLESSLDVIGAHEDFAQILSDEIAGVRRRIAGTVGEIEDGMTLKAACISCRGIDAESGQAMYTLRLRAKPDPVIMCVNPACDPSEAVCGSWIQGRPAWPQREWDWLADRICDAEVVAVE